MEIKVQDLMTSSGVKFGTSGARGLAADMTDLRVLCIHKGIPAIPGVYRRIE